MVNEILKRFNVLKNPPQILHEDYLHPLTTAELIELISKLPDKTIVMTSNNDGEDQVYVVEFQKNPPRLFLL